MFESNTQAKNRVHGASDKLSTFDARKPSFMNPTKSSVHKGYIVPNVGQVSDGEMMKNFNDQIRGGKNNTQHEKTIKKGVTKEFNIDLGDNVPISGETSSRNSRNPQLPPHPNANGVPKAKAAMKSKG